jgi:hypothetical protein
MLKRILTKISFEDYLNHSTGGAGKAILHNKIENEMATTTLNQTIATSYSEKTSKVSLITRFMNWCRGQEKNRLLWLGIALSAHGCIITPITIMVVLLAGTNLFLFILALVAMGATLVTNLAAMPTRITLPVFILSTLVDIAIIFSCVFIGLDIARTYI